MGTRLVSVALLLLLGATICCTARTLFTFEESPYGAGHGIGVGYGGGGGGAAGGSGGGGGGGSGGGYGIGGQSGPSFDVIGNHGAGYGSGEPHMIYTYRQAISGFEAILTLEELQALKSKRAVLSVYPEHECKFRTTYSPKFLGLSRWDRLWLDLVTNGHVTPTASTVAGSFVEDASILGNAEGTASGLAPGAHLVVYKVSSCTSIDVLKSMDQAIRDRADVLPMCKGFSKPLRFDNDDISIGSFAAIAWGLVLVQRVGNNGPFPSGVRWSSMDLNSWIECYG
ncbi:uncharacterized protein A4U43_C10F3880 [Asparagus officinalis]|uniref:Inhibitor I9 domain-containing protein n=1 Tax=Asparagus officinalis TaxID=4686 RepID=A0A5P1E3Q4_ASPOF|nr:uncharacterized protein A4U43_C10F3880 [Asparagus officinalis]